MSTLNQFYNSITSPPEKQLINDQFNRLGELSPLVPKPIAKKFKIKYKDSEIGRPPEINGLEQIQIYTKADTDSIPTLCGSDTETKAESLIDI